MKRQIWVSPDAALPLTRQCALAGVARATLYAHRRPKATNTTDLTHRRLIDEEYTRHPFYGTRRMVIHLQRAGHAVNRKRVQRLMREMGLAGIAPGPNTSRAHPAHKIYPYLLRGVPITRPNQVWSTDITYIRLARGFVYLVAIIDWYSRKVLAWRISNSMEAVFCADCLEDALREHGTPEIFNSDQGAQFTSAQFTGILKREGITISMDGRGRAFDNIFVERLWRSVKHEDVYLKGYAEVEDLLIGLAEYFVFYNGERPHQGLGNATPDTVYEQATGGGAIIVNKFGAGGVTPVPLRSTGVTPPATASARAESTSTTRSRAESTSTPGQRRSAACAVNETA